MSSIHHSSFIIHHLLPTDSWVRALIAPAIVFIACCIDRNYQTDLWHHLARGRVIVEEGKLLDEDRFTYTIPGKQFQDVNWLAQVAFFKLYQPGGLELLQAVNAALLAAMMGMVVEMCRKSGAPMAIAGAVGLFTFAGLWENFLIRPQTFSLLLFVSLYAVLEGSERRPWLLLLAPLHLALWVNLHGAFPIGLVLIGCYALAAFFEAVGQRKGGVLRDRRVWLLASCLAASALATLMNPYGWRVYEYVVLTSGIARARRIDEWLPPGLNTLTGIVWFTSLAGVLLLLILPGRRVSVRQLCLLIVFAIPAFGGVRMVAWWLLVLAPIAARWITDRLPRSEPAAPASVPRPNLGAMLTCLALFAGMVLSLPWLESVSPFRLVRPMHRVEEDLEETTVQLRKLAAEGNIFTRLEWSEYLTWKLGPDFKVFMDGRIEIFPDEVWREYSAVTRGDAGWEQILDRHDVRFLLIDTGPYHGKLRPRVESSPAVWERVGEAGPVLLFRRMKK
jgi:hypothetical protein